jgi:hypothetical protein
MSGEEGSTTGSPTPSQSSDPPSSDDAMSQVDISTEYLADQERQSADRADSDASTQQERVDKGLFHRNEGRTRETGGR